jgi:hypothetical protein
VATRATEQVNATVFTDPQLDSEDIKALIEVLQRLRHSAGDFDGRDDP